jgi:hypothetical protein
VSGLKALLLNLQNNQISSERTDTPCHTEQVAEYTNFPLATIYQKTREREIPGSSQVSDGSLLTRLTSGWRQTARIHSFEDEEQTLLSLHAQRKPNKSSWNDENLVDEVNLLQNL